MSIIGFAAKSVGVAGLSVGIFGLSWWGWSIALIGAVCALYFERGKRPEKVLESALWVLIHAFCGGMVALALPSFQFLGLGEFFKSIPEQSLIFCTTLSLRFIVGIGKPWLKGKFLKPEEIK